MRYNVLRERKIFHTKTMTANKNNKLCTHSSHNRSEVSNSLQLLLLLLRTIIFIGQWKSPIEALL